jgi:hypothetical protein
MHQPKLLRSKLARFAMIPTASLLCVIASSCADLQTTGPGVTGMRPRLERGNVSFNRFFVAWSQEYASGPIETQIFALDIRQDRQYANWWPDESVLSFARAYPGKLYIVGDEPDQYCVAPSEYAGTYRDFVTTVRRVDPTAKFSPAGFAEPNDRCCPQEPEPPDVVCRATRHSIGYAEAFYNAYVQLYGSPPPVDEWRFHDFGIFINKGDIDGWWLRIDKEATWAVNHGANMVLAAWGFNAWDLPVSTIQEFMKISMNRMLNDRRINQAAYWAYQPWEHTRWPLVTDGNLTPVGQTHANPLTDIPTSARLVANNSNGRVKLAWANTTSAWATEAEFWVQAAGSNLFVRQHIEQITAPGATETPFVAYRNGDMVKARVRYYNMYGQAEWSAFSSPVTIASAQSGQGKALGKGPITCLLLWC